jgi:glycerol uptake facilitator-like aquaporin
VLIRKAFAELIGTCFLVMVVVGSGIMAENLSSDNLNILIANTLATGAGLTALIWIFINVSGAHFNPAVSLIMFFKKELNFSELSFYIFFQFLGGFIGVVLANLMFGLDALSFSQKDRGGFGIYLGEFIATFGLLITIIGVREFNKLAIAPAVGLYITAGYWFTSSTSFANPAVTLSRMFTDTFTGISNEFVASFILFQLIGAITAMLFMRFINNK